MTKWHSPGTRVAYSVRTYYRLKGPGFECPCGRDFLDPFRMTPRPIQPTVVFRGSLSCGYSSWGKAPLQPPGSSMGTATLLPLLCTCLAYNRAAIDNLPLLCLLFCKSTTNRYCKFQPGHWFSTWHHIFFINYTILKNIKERIVKWVPPNLQYCLSFNYLRKLTAPPRVDSLCSFDLCWAMAVVNGKIVCFEGQVLLEA